MTKAEVKKLLELPVEQRAELAEMLWQSVQKEDEVRLVPIPDWQHELLAERLADLDQNPDDEEPWEQVKAELWPGA